MEQLEPELAREPGHPGPPPTSRNLLYRWLRALAHRRTREVDVPSLAHLARAIPMPYRTLKHALQHLVAAGHISMERVDPPGTAVRFTVTTPWRRSDAKGVKHG